MIDTHCHIDFHNDPVGLARDMEESQTECVAVSMLPSHYRLGLPHLNSFTKVHASLGMHPLRVSEGKNEVDAFTALSRECEFIGEIGLDFSKEGKPTKEIQIEVLLRIVNSFRGGKFVSVHSRGAAREVLNIFNEYNTGPVCFHYFTGGHEVASEAVNCGHYFSFNRRMLKGKHKALLDIIPRDRVLVESDAPFLSKAPISATKEAYLIIGEYWETSLSETERTISRNFQNCRTAS